MTTVSDWGTVLLDTVKELAAQPGGGPWTAVANGLVKLLEEHATLKAEVERLRSCDRTNIREQARLINERDTMKEALRRVVEAMTPMKLYWEEHLALVVKVSTDHDCFVKEQVRKMAEALAYAKGVATPTQAHEWKTCNCPKCNQRKIDEDYYGPAREYREDADRGKGSDE